VNSRVGVKVPVVGEGVERISVKLHKGLVCLLRDVGPYCIRQHTSAYVSMRCVAMLVPNAVQVISVQ
jgi:hypothetical protein